jgi:hypothetical protein
MKAFRAGSPISLKPPIAKAAASCRKVRERTTPSGYSVKKT